MFCLKKWFEGFFRKIAEATPSGTEFIQYQTKMDLDMVT